MRRDAISWLLVGLFVAGAATAACSSSSATDSAGGSDGGGGGEASSPADGGGAPADGASPGDAAQPAYAGGEVTITVIPAEVLDAGASDAGSAGDASGDAGSASGAISGKATIRLVAATPAAISKIEVLVDGKSAGVVTAMPFDVPWDTTALPNGTHAITATAHDLAGLTAPAKELDVTTANFQLAGAWKWTGITDTDTGFPTDNCSDAAFTVTFDAASGLVTFPTIDVTCTAGNGAPYTSTVKGFTTTVTPAHYNDPISYSYGYTTVDFSTAKLTQTEMPFPPKQMVLSGALSR